jgi:arabinose-5-phosphate isomerase
MLEAGKDLEVVKAGEIYSAHPKTVLPEMLVSDALDIMRGNNITQLLVADTKGTYLGVIHLHDILKEGII